MTVFNISLTIHMTLLLLLNFDLMYFRVSDIRLILLLSSLNDPPTGIPALVTTFEFPK